VQLPTPNGLRDPTPPKLAPIYLCTENVQSDIRQLYGGRSRTMERDAIHAKEDVQARDGHDIKFKILPVVANRELDSGHLVLYGCLLVGFAATEARCVSA
ncbi:hypothetical protein PROFUN_16880, partial [Planoprotostelium fungivorum]